MACYLLMIVCDGYFVKSLDTLSKKWNLSDNVAGATLMAIGSSAPEFFTALIALFSGGSVGLGAGTIIGSAIFNILCICGGSALFLNMTLKKGPLFRDVLFYTAFILLIGVTFWDGHIAIWEAAIYVVLYGLYIGYIALFDARGAEDDNDMVETGIEDIEQEAESRYPILKLVDGLVAYTYPKTKHREKHNAWVFVISIVWIGVLSRLLVESALVIAHTLGVSDVIIGLTVLAVGTSVPDFLSSVIVAKQGRGDMSISNALGSNIFNIGMCMGAPRLLYLAFGHEVLVGSGDLLTSLGILLGVLAMATLTLAITRFRINKYVGYVFLGVYVLYVVTMVIIA